MGRFDEKELDVVTGFSPSHDGQKPVAASSIARRFFAVLTDVSLLAALTFALLPLLPSSRDALSVIALAGFILLVSYYYFVASWLLWRKTIGGTIFDVRVVAADGETIPFMSATMRWIGVWMSILTGGIGFVVGLPNRLSNTKSV